MAVSIERLREVFDLDVEKGALTWRTTSRGHKAGARAGSKQPDGYTRIYVDGSKIPAHRIVWAMVNGRWPDDGKVIDHINGDPGDDRPENLREVTWQQNSQNRQRAAANNRCGSKVPGVCYVKSANRFQVHLRIDGRLRVMGSHRDLGAAEDHALRLRRKHYRGNTL